MACISEYGVGYTDEGGHEARVYSHGDVRNGEAHACTNHADDTGDEDAEDARDGKPGKAVEGARERADEGWNGEDTRIEHKAKFTIGERAEGDLAGKKLASGGEDREDDSAEGEDFAANWAEEYEACVTHVVYLRGVSIEELNLDKAFAIVYKACFLPRIFWVGNGNENPSIPSGCLNLN